MKLSGIGLKGERIAAKFLLDKGLEFKERNYQKKIGEIDLVFKDGDITVFVEVKTRTSDLYGEGFESVDSRKLRKLTKLIQFYCLENNLDLDKSRLDVISIAMGDNGRCKIKHFVKVL